MPAHISSRLEQVLSSEIFILTEPNQSSVVNQYIKDNKNEKVEIHHNVLA